MRSVEFNPEIEWRQGREPMSVIVDLHEGETVEMALKRFKRKCVRESVFQDIRKNSYYDKPSVRKRKKHLRAVKRMKKGPRKSFLSD
ncbi:MAG TPA: 30S ribosomal protein S21 [bacterium]|nr:30S ribosomal protein S21 [bacterium]